MSRRPEAVGWIVLVVWLAAGCGVERERRAAGVTTSAASATSAAPAPAEPPSEWETEKAWAEARGVVIEPNVTTVVAKRRGPLARSNRYEDTIVVFRSDRKLVRFVATTKPAQMPNESISVVPDVDKDGRKDLGMVRPGVYRAIGGVTFGLPGHERTAFKLVTEEGEGGLPAWRDLDGDGVFSPWERAVSEQRGYTITGVYIHYGFEPEGRTIGKRRRAGPWTVGCQNVRWDELDDFVAAVGGPEASFRYAIVDE